MKIIQVSDTHLMPPGEFLYGSDPRARLERMIADINEQHGDAAFCVFSGDLCNHGQAAAYRELRACLDGLALPFYPMVGNHDDRQGLLAAFPEAPRDGEGFVQGGIDCAAGRVLLLDTFEPGTSAGSFCARRAAWLRAELEAAGARPVYLFLHHPPFDIGIPSLDAIRLLDPGRLVAELEGRDNIRHLFFGHVHRPVSGSWRGIPFSALRSTNHQVAFDMAGRLANEPGGKVPKADECAGYAVILIDHERVVVHQNDVIAGSLERL